MTTITLPVDTVRFYNDGPGVPDTPILLEAEKAYRIAFADAAAEVVRWGMMRDDLIEQAWCQRQQVREQAEVLVSSADLYDVPELDSEQIVYRSGHEVAASCIRGRVQALEIGRRCWDEFHEVGTPVEAILVAIFIPWSDRVAEWSRSPIAPTTILTPPRPEDGLTEDHMRLLDFVRDRAEADPQPEPSLLMKTVRQLVNEFPELRRPVIHGLLREGETMNVVASPKVGKSWLVTDLAMAVATGGRWLDCFQCEKGEVLIIDNELHEQTSAHRIPKVLDARGIAFSSVADRVSIINIRGGLKDIFGMNDTFNSLRPGRFKIIVLDAVYRFMPRNMDENDNGTMAQIYNQLDGHAARLGCAFVLVHHSSKGSQSGKSITDVGAGAGSQSRATDTHLILRPHEQDDVAVLDAAVRSWPPVSPRCLRWTFPVWTPDDSLDPTLLRPERPRRRPKNEPEKKSRKTPSEPEWDTARFAETFVSDDPVAKAVLVNQAHESGLSLRKAGSLIEQAEAEGLIYRWRFGANQQVKFATQPQPEKPA
jgi:hypothetical protein